MTDRSQSAPESERPGHDPRPSAPKYEILNRIYDNLRKCSYLDAEHRDFVLLAIRNDADALAALSDTVAPQIKVARECLGNAKGLSERSYFDLRDYKPALAMVNQLMADALRALKNAAPQDNALVAQSRAPGSNREVEGSRSSERTISATPNTAEAAWPNAKEFHRRLMEYRLHERHNNVAETSYWLTQYKHLAEDAINHLLRSGERPLP